MLVLQEGLVDSGVLEGGRLLQLLSGQVSGGKVAWVRRALSCLSWKNQDLPPLQTLTAKAQFLALGWGRGHPGHAHDDLPEVDGNSLAGSLAWEGAPAWPGHLQDNHVGAVRGAPPSITQHPHNSCLMEKSNVSKDTNYFFHPVLISLLESPH